MKLRELLQQHQTVTADGAMGTYFSQLTGQSAEGCEKANLTAPDVIRRIHREYRQAGAVLLRTNTFSANTYSLNVSREELKEILTRGYEIARECARGQAVVCADVSAIYDNELTAEEISEEYRFIADTFIACGAKTFLFETLSEIEPVLPAMKYILSVMPDAEIVASFTVLPDGCTRSGVSVHALLESIVQYQNLLTVVGFNCGCGASQLLPYAVPFFSYIQKNTDLYTMLLPNSGYPSIEDRRTVFHSSPLYFAEQTARFLPYGISVLGGCCGTVPESISLLNGMISGNTAAAVKKIPDFPKKTGQAAFASCLTEDRFIIAAELDPPNHADLSKILSAARTLKEAGVNVITVSDSPLGHAKMDSVVCSARIMREVGIEVLPHLCCRDKNINALRSLLLGAHSEGIRAVLAVTGDHIAETDRGVIKPVFNMDSTRFMELISRMNEDVFADSPIAVGGAYDPAKRKTEYSLKRLDRKLSNGAKFVLTQPVFSEEAIDSLKQARAKGVKVLAGIMPLVSWRNANFMQNEVPGMQIPDELVQRFRSDMSREEAAETGIRAAVEIAEKVRPYADGFYFITPFNRAEIISQIIKRL